jgi:histidinol-phosphate/aromatic aminotransferase/cobyric acid decarboxylase-like protein
MPRTRRAHSATAWTESTSTWWPVSRERSPASSASPPPGGAYSIDKYFDRDDLPIVFDDGLYEIRLLTVVRTRRGGRLGPLLMYAAYRWVAGREGRAVVAIGRREIRDLYLRSGLRPLGRKAAAGRVQYELMAADLEALGEVVDRRRPLVKRMLRDVDWRLSGVGPGGEEGCVHGGDSFDAVGRGFEHLERIPEVVNADVLDAWFDPAPAVLSVLSRHLAWSLRTSPPTSAEGLREAIARARGVPAAAVLPAAGSSNLIFLALQRYLTPRSRALVLDPMYGEYAFVLERLVGCWVDRFTLHPEDRFDVDPERLGRHLRQGYDWVVLANPNSPTGRHLARAALEPILAQAPAATRFWIDETYVDYAGSDESLEKIAAESRNVLVCKSMSKVYALSGARCAYLIGPPRLVAELRAQTPPWAVSLPAQLAAVTALRETAYYQEAWCQTARLRDELGDALAADPGLTVTPSVANFLLCQVGRHGPDLATLLARCRARDLYLRDVGSMGETVGDRWFRIAVKDQATNQRMIDILRRSVRD